MAIDQKQLLQSIYDAIFDALTVTPSGIGGGQPILRRASTYMSLQLPGNPVDSAQFANPWSPSNPNGSVAASENFATLVDPVPLLTPSYAVGGVSTDTVYGEIVRANVNAQQPDPEGQKAYEKAFNTLFVDGQDFDENGLPVTVKVDSPLYRNYKNKFQLYNAALLSYTTNFLQYDLSKPEDQRKWAILAPVLRAPVDLAYQDLQAASPGVVESALATLGQFQQSSLAGIFSRARQTYLQTRRGSLVDPNIFWHLCEAFPGNWFAESGATNFTALTLQSSRLRLNEESRFSRYGSGGGINLGLWRVGAAGSTERTQYSLQTETSNMTISFRFGRIEIRRRWLDASLMSLRGWSTAGRRPGDYSTGEVNDKNEGIFSLLPSSFILARDIKISADWGSTDLQRATQSTSIRGSVGFGPFSLSGSYQNSSSTRRFASSFDGTTLTVPGAQIVAWLSSVVPYSPPTDGPPSARAEQLALTAARQPARANVYATPWLESLDAADVESVPGPDTVTGGNGEQEPAGAQGATPEPPPEAFGSQFVSAES
ncbi:hypothetical protein [Streptomyces silvensis]|uniref:hypothetical protein n=1 Tax=Streptomyces silvensis TaxID=1765722 RepID=UPI000AEE2CEA|nr:hypothetical protein [Streptomyces silvensis]